MTPASTQPATATDDSPRARNALGLALVVLVMVLGCGGGKHARAWFALPVELILPGAVHEGGSPDWPLLVERRPALLRHIPAAVLELDPVSDPWTPCDASLWAGFLPPLLALFACALARGPVAWTGRGLLVVALALLVTAPAYGSPRLLLLLALALLAGVGLQRLGRHAASGQGEGPVLALAGVAVLGAAGLIALSLWAGARPDAEVVQPLLRHGGEPFEMDAGNAPAVIAINAAWLRAVLDRAAVAGFLSMCALLLHLKSRGTLTGLLVVLAVAVDLLSVRWLL